MSIPPRTPWAERLAGWPGLVPSAFIAALFCLFLPAQVYESNAAFLYFPFAQMLLVLLPLFLAAWALVAIVTALGPYAVRRFSAAVVGGLAIASWASATFVTASHGQLDGKSLLALASPAEYAPNLLLWIACVLAWAAIAWRVRRAATRFLAAFLAVQLLYCAWIVVHEDKPWRKRPAVERLMTFSADRNVLVILLDAFQADFLGDIMASDPSLIPEFEGFTWFADVMGVAVTTYLSLPTIHSGVPIRSGAGIRALYHDAVVEGSFMGKMARSGYDSMLVNPILNVCPRDVRCEHFDQVVHGQSLPLKENVAFLEILSLFRAAPKILKPAVYRDGEWIGKLQVVLDDAKTSNDLLDRMASNVRPGATRPVVRFLHLFNTHGGAALDADCRPVHGEPWNRATALAQDHCALTHVVRLLKRLREQDLFDNTAIVLLADHGSGLPRHVNDFGAPAAAGPLLMVKPFRAHRPFTTSRKLVGLEDVGASICAWTDACRPPNPGRDVLAAGGGPRVFPFIAYVWQAKYFGADSVPLDNVYEVSGPPGDMASWRRVTNLLKDHIPEVRFADTDSLWSYGFGWGGFERVDGRTVRRSVTNAADLYVNLDPAHDEQLEFEVKSDDALAKPQAVTVEVNGTPVGSFPVSTMWSRQSVTLPRTVIAADVDHIVLRFADDDAAAHPPAVVFDDLRVRPAPAP